MLNHERYLCALTIRHTGCWLSELSSSFPKIEAALFVTELRRDDYSALLVIWKKDRHLTTSKELQQIMFYLLSEGSVGRVSHIPTDMHSVQVLSVVINDSRKRETFRNLVTCGGELNSIVPIVSENGVERVSAFFGSENEAKNASAYMRKIYHGSWVKEEVCLISNELDFSIEHEYSLPNVLFVDDEFRSGTFKRILRSDEQTIQSLYESTPWLATYLRGLIKRVIRSVVR
ncbi:MAG TPA: hypothetical protein VMW36_08815 [Patescibacteria group bacterium]|nr:hypothetical protein [Patescibacteria group bacterium]